MTNHTYIPLDISESASLKDSKTLLPKTIYDQLKGFIEHALETAKSQSGSADLNESRSHNAVSIDGTRGTGKTSVLVNLKKYLEDTGKELLKEVHILEPIDPTLLEDGESLFLHIIVAAVLHDRDLKEAQRSAKDGARELNQCLERLAHALESVEQQKERYGMDKLRALYGNRHLADCVHDFFRAALKLLNKQLLILPIDDVDTALNRAFENLEIIRRYLTTPYVLPIVSGDRDLYNEVTWRDFHGRLTKDSNYRRHEAYKTAEGLAHEYQRKILPVPRRLTMPEVSSYWQDNTIQLRKEVGNSPNILPLANFITWLTIFIAGPVNGLEGSNRTLPIPSIRALAQLLTHCGSDLIELLPKSIREADKLLNVQRAWQMPTATLSAIEDFQEKYREITGKKGDRDYSPAYRAFSEALSEEHANTPTDDHKVLTQRWTERLISYFRFEPEAGAVYLILLAKSHWLADHHGSATSIFNTPLFQPLTQGHASLALFNKPNDIADWAIQLKKKLPETWLTAVKNQKTILPYPTAEVGINTSKSWDYQKEVEHSNANVDQQSKANLLISLLTQHNFYKSAQRTMMLNIGRIFELIIASLVSPLTLEDMQRIQREAPFFSTSSLAPTKTLTIEDEQQRASQYSEEEQSPEPQDSQHEYLAKLHAEIEQWRETHNLGSIYFSPWLIYKVFNKVYSQIASDRYYPNGMKDIGTAFDIVGKVFYATWSAFGSFEKGRLFGLPEVVTTVNLNKTQNFEKNNDHFNVNVSAFAPRSNTSDPETGNEDPKTIYGQATRTASYFLADHPLRKWFEGIELGFPPAPKKQNSGSTIEKVSKTKKARDDLYERLDLPVSERLQPDLVMDTLSDMNAGERRDLVDHMNKMHPNTSATEAVNEAIGKIEGHN